MPSLLVTFYLEKDPELENKLMEIVMKIFNSRLLINYFIIIFIINYPDKNFVKH